MSNKKISVWMADLTGAGNAVTLFSDVETEAARIVVDSLETSGFWGVQTQEAKKD